MIIEIENEGGTVTEINEVLIKMKILIVYGFQDNSKGTKTFMAFQATTYNIFKLESHLVDTEIEFYKRSLSKLDDLLYRQDYVLLRSRDVYVDLLICIQYREVPP